MQTSTSSLVLRGISSMATRALLAELAQAYQASTGLAVAIPEGMCMLVFPRSGLAARFSVRLANCVAVIDSDYRGEILVPLTCDAESETGYFVAPGDRIAQAMLIPVPVVWFEEVDDVEGTERGDGGFGSSGK